MTSNATSQATSTTSAATADVPVLDVAIIGAGIAGMYALHSLRKQGLSVKVYDAASGVGGTWWWNRYPGARVDFPGGPFYCYTFSEDLVREWDWEETQPDRDAVLAYLNHVADKFDLRRDIYLETYINSAEYDEGTQRWTIESSTGVRVSAQFLICAVGTLSAANTPDIPGLESFAGACYHTGLWPQEKVDFTGKRVGVIGTGSSGIQAIPVIAEAADHLTVFQRTPQYSIPAGNRPVDPEVVRNARADWPAMCRQMMKSPVGSPFPAAEFSAKDHTPEQRRETYETLWHRGGLGIIFNSYNDVLTDREANDELAEFIREKIRQKVQNPELLKKLLPDYVLGTKRQVLDDGYFEAMCRDNVTLVDLREDAIESITPDGVRTASGEHPVDILVLATGFDAISGAFERLNPRGRGGLTLKEKWSDRFSTYLGMTIPEFPNLFMIHGPESPSVLFNMPLGAELQADWIRDCIGHLRAQGLGAIEAASAAEAAWGEEVAEIASHTLFADSESWYSGSNIPGKHHQFTVYLGGPPFYQRLIDVADKGYQGFVFEKAVEKYRRV